MVSFEFILEFHKLSTNKSLILFTAEKSEKEMLKGTLVLELSPSPTILVSEKGILGKTVSKVGTPGSYPTSILLFHPSWSRLPPTLLWTVHFGISTWTPTFLVTRKWYVIKIKETEECNSVTAFQELSTKR